MILLPGPSTPMLSGRNVLGPLPTPAVYGRPPDMGMAFPNWKRRFQLKLGGQSRRGCVHVQQRRHQAQQHSPPNKRSGSTFRLDPGDPTSQPSSRATSPFFMFCTRLRADSFPRHLRQKKDPWAVMNSIVQRLQAWLARRYPGPVGSLKIAFAAVPLGPISCDGRLRVVRSAISFLIFFVSCCPVSFLYLCFLLFLVFAIFDYLSRPLNRRAPTAAQTLAKRLFFSRILHLL